MNNTFCYNIQGIYFTLFSKNPKKILAKLYKIPDSKLAEISQRVSYYCGAKISPSNILQNTTPSKKEMLTHSRYCYDFWEFMRFFPKNLSFSFCAGDVNTPLMHPTFCKSRPIPYGAMQDSKNNILLKLDKKRHFGTMHLLSQKPRPIASFYEKKDLVFFRGGCYQKHRKDFMRLFFHHPLLDAGHVGSLGDEELKKWFKGKSDLSTHLKHKFILSLEGNDVATNLKWIMASNSLAIMPKPKFETWFMEGTLFPDIHYVLLDDDFKNLEEKVEWILKNPKIAENIIYNANTYVKKFLDKSQEDLLNFLVLRKYFYQTGQIEVTKIEEEIFNF